MYTQCLTYNCQFRDLYRHSVGLMIDADSRQSTTTEKYLDRQTDRQTHRLIDKQTDRQALVTQADRVETRRSTDKPLLTHACTAAVLNYSY